MKAFFWGSDLFFSRLDPGSGRYYKYNTFGRIRARFFFGVGSGCWFTFRGLDPVNFHPDPKQSAGKEQKPEQIFLSTEPMKSMFCLRTLQ